MLKIKIFKGVMIGIIIAAMLLVCFISILAFKWQTGIKNNNANVNAVDGVLDFGYIDGDYLSEEEYDNNTIFEISNYYELLSFAKSVCEFDFENKIVKLTKSIDGDYSQVHYPFYGIGSCGYCEDDGIDCDVYDHPFKGEFDGCGFGFEYFNYTIYDHVEHTGFFQYTENATIKNVMFANICINDEFSYDMNENNAILTGFTKNTTIENVSIAKCTYNYNHDKYASYKTGSIISASLDSDGNVYKNLRISNVNFNGISDKYYVPLVGGDQSYWYAENIIASEIYVDDEITEKVTIGDEENGCVYYADAFDSEEYSLDDFKFLKSIDDIGGEEGTLWYYCDVYDYPVLRDFVYWGSVKFLVNSNTELNENVTIVCDKSEVWNGDVCFPLCYLDLEDFNWDSKISGNVITCCDKTIIVEVDEDYELKSITSSYAGSYNITIEKKIIIYDIMFGLPKNCNLKVKFNNQVVSSSELKFSVVENSKIEVKADKNECVYKFTDFLNNNYEFIFTITNNKYFINMNNEELVVDENFAFNKPITPKIEIKTYHIYIK